MKLAHILSAISFAAIIGQPLAARTAPPDLSTAKALYAAASYEEALAALSNIKGEDVGQVEQYRALCLIALGRTDEARQSFERLVALQPRYKISEADFSPRVVTMFHEVRQQLLPAAAKEIYAKAKTSFETKQYTAASAQLKEMFAILEDDDMPEDVSGLGDLKMLGEGFLALAESQLAAARQAALANPPASSPGSAPVSPRSAPPSAEVSTGPKIYSGTDKEVTPPVDIDRRMPPWTPLNVADRNLPHRGVVEIVINEKGAVESVAIQKSVSSTYDPPLTEAAKKWQFRPATLNGQPVKYWISYEIVLKAQ